VGRQQRRAASMIGPWLSGAYHPRSPPGMTSVLLSAWCSGAGPGTSPGTEQTNSSERAVVPKIFKEAAGYPEASGDREGLRA
jgi:hypothetical protein